MQNIPGYSSKQEKISETNDIVIYRGNRQSDDLPILIKTLKGEYPISEELSRLKHEYAITRNLNIPGILQPIELLKVGNSLTLIQEDFGGIPLNRSPSSARMPIAQFLSFAIQLVEILRHIHENHIIHKDIRPANIYIHPETIQLRLSGFSIATNLSQETQQIVKPDLLEGALAYMSPEQTGRMNRNIDHRTDFYSLGIVLYEMLAGRLPFQAEDPMGWVYCHIAAQPLPLESHDRPIPAALVEIILKLLSKDAEDRYRNAWGLRRDLEECRHLQETTNDIAPFRLGRHDMPKTLQISQILYGREKELFELLGAFWQTMEGTTQLIMLSGPAGIGKSSVIQEVYKPIVECRGLFVSGKFDQFKRTIPYSALIQACQELVSQILTETEEELTGWRNKLQRALGSNAGIICEVIPDLELIVGLQAPVKELPPEQARNRLHLTFQNFIYAFPDKQHPLVLFLDDLQWSDLGTLEMLKFIATDLDAKYLLIIGAYRNDDLKKNHPVLETLEDISNNTSNIQSSHLQPLELNDIANLLVDTIGYRSKGRKLTYERVKRFAELILQKTQGTPFFVSEFIKTLHQENLFTFDPDSGLWNWDLRKIKAKQITDNVVQLMSEKIQKLSAPTHEIIKIAAVIGNVSTLRMLAKLTGKSIHDAAEDLTEALQENLLVPLDETYKYADEEVEISFPSNGSNVRYRFLHDRVRQAAYIMLTSEQREEWHLRIGRAILENDSENFEDKLFNIVTHMNSGANLLETKEERYDLACLNLKATVQARASAAYELASKYAVSGLTILPGSPWRDYYDLAFTFYKEYSECEYLCGNFRTAEEIFNKILAYAKSKYEKIQIYNIRIVLYVNMAKFPEAVQTGLEGLRMFDVDLGTAEDWQAAVENELEDARKNIGKRAIGGLIELPALSDPIQKICITLLMNMIPCSFNYDQNLFSLVALRMVNISLRYGNTDASSFAYATYGVILGSARNDYESAYELGRLGLQLSEKLQSREFKPKIYHLLACFIIPWKKHLSVTFGYFEKTLQSGLDVGDFTTIGFSIMIYIPYQFIAGTELETMQKDMRKHMNFLEKTQQQLPLAGLQIFWQMTRTLQGLNFKQTSFGDKDFSEEEFLIYLFKHKLNYGLNCYYLLKTELFFLYGHYAEALRMIHEYERIMAATMGSLFVSEFHFYRSLILTKLYPAAEESKQKEFRALLQQSLSLFDVWVKHCPENFLQQQLLIQAEIARIEGKKHTAIDLYENAIEESSQQGFLQNEALANELMAHFYLEIEKPKIAGLYVREARHAYIRWGAMGKVRQLEEIFPHFLATNEPEKNAISGVASHTTKPLDFDSIMKASTAIIGEIVLERLLEKLMGILMENAGAVRGFLILKQGGKYFVETEADEKGMRVLHSEPLSEHSQLAAGIVQYVIRTTETVVLDDASRDGRFTGDPYILQQQPKSVLCKPLLTQGKIIGILYLENNYTSGAFTADRLKVLSLLSAQASISIENARLYSNLERALDRQMELSQSYSRFVPREFLQLLGEKDIVDVEYGSHVQKRMTILFSDIRAFTTLSESMTPEENFRFLNSYLSRMNPIVIKHGGFIDKYIGDAIMALFTADPDNAVNAAIGMLQKLTKFNLVRKRRKLPPIRIGIGLNTGELMLGTVGSHSRMEGTVIGDAVNLASRIEQLTKIYGVSLLVAEFTYENMKNKANHSIRIIDRVAVKGKQQAVTVYEIFDADPDELRAAKEATKRLFRRGFLLFQEGKWKRALEVFQDCLEKNPADKVIRVYLHRCRVLLDEGHVLDSKKY